MSNYSRINRPNNRPLILVRETGTNREVIF